VPAVLRADLYALAALAGATVVVIADGLHLSPIASAIGGGLLCFALRYAAIRHGWHLPAARPAAAEAKRSDEPDEPS